MCHIKKHCSIYSGFIYYISTLVFIWSNVKRLTKQITMSPWLCLGIHVKQVNANTSAALLIGKPSQVHDDVDIKIKDIRIEQLQSVKNLGIYVDNRFSWDASCDKLFFSNVAGKISTRHWASVKEGYDYFTSMISIRAINGLPPPYLTDSIVIASKVHSRNTRLTHPFDVHVPSHNSEIIKRS